MPVTFHNNSSILHNDRICLHINIVQSNHGNHSMREIGSCVCAYLRVCVRTCVCMCARVCVCVGVCMGEYV